MKSTWRACATAEAGGETIPVAEIAVEGARRWFATHLHALDIDRHVRIHPKLHPGSADLRTRFEAARTGVPWANDTPIGVGYAPLSPLERLVLAVERAVVAKADPGRRPACGEDVKVMGVRSGDRVRLTLSCARIGAHLPDLKAYLGEKSALRALVLETAAGFGFAPVEVAVNAADRPDFGEVYLTVTGALAEAGGDGQVGRGNRINGLITPGRPMSLEAAAGKNPVGHVGKIYNVAAQAIARRIVADLPEVLYAECLLVSRIGAPITTPAVAEVRIALADPAALPALSVQVEVRVEDAIARLPAAADAFLNGAIGLY